MSFDLLIKNGTIIDGTGRLRHKADLGIDHGKIETIGRLDEAGAGRVIDGSGLVVAHGFIDMHSHSDVSLLDKPAGDSKAYQGVTTEVTGNCGPSPFPVGPRGDAGMKASSSGSGRTSTAGPTSWSPTASA